MRNYIQKCNRNDKDAIMEDFIILTTQRKDENGEVLNAASYIYVKNWFLSTFPEIKQSREEHKKKVQSILTDIAV